MAILSAGGRGFPAALHFPRSRLSAGGDGGAGSGGPQGRFPGTEDPSGIEEAQKSQRALF